MLAGLTGTASAASAPTPSAAISSLNAFRAQAGLLPVTADAAQTRACRRHAAAYARTPVVGHFEIRGTPGYSTSGDHAARTSVLAYTRRPMPGPEVWIASAYHRLALLDPRLRSTGYWSEHGIACMGVIDGIGGPTVVRATGYPYPADGQTGVATAVGCVETPDPCRALDGASRRRAIGMPVTIQFDSPQPAIDGLRVLSASLRPAGGGRATRILIQDMRTKAVAPLLRGGAVLLPRRPLRPATDYLVRVRARLVTRTAFGHAVTTRVERRWRFTTAAHRR